MTDQSLCLQGKHFGILFVMLLQKTRLLLIRLVCFPIFNTVYFVMSTKSIKNTEIKLSQIHTYLQWDFV